MKHVANVRRAVLTALLVLAAAYTVILYGKTVKGASMPFRVPSTQERERAVGSLEGLPETLKRAFTPGNDFQPIRDPGPNDWLAQHPEPHQTYDDFVASWPNKPDTKQNIIYLVPMGQFEGALVPSLTHLRDFAAAYFAMKVELMPAVELNSVKLTTRINSFTQRKQILTDDVLTFLKTKLPGDAFCMLAVTMEDLYPDPSWNFVFGQASLRERVGVYSFARYMPSFYGKAEGPNDLTIVLQRSFKVLAHETAHMFGLTHCTFYECVLTGSNHLEETDARPVHLCPICLRKLQYSIGFDVLDRYRNLKLFYSSTGLDEEAEWIAKRIEEIGGR